MRSMLYSRGSRSFAHGYLRANILLCSYIVCVTEIKKYNIYVLCSLTLVKLYFIYAQLLIPQRQITEQFNTGLTMHMMTELCTCVSPKMIKGFTTIIEHDSSP